MQEGNQTNFTVIMTDERDIICHFVTMNLKIAAILSS